MNDTENKQEGTPEKDLDNHSKKPGQKRRPARPRGHAPSQPHATLYPHSFDIYDPRRRQIHDTDLSGENKEGQWMLKSSTVNISHFFSRCSHEFKYLPSQNPKRILTKPSERRGNDSYDNENSDLVLCVNDILQSETGDRSFRILDLLGQGTFGQVVRCENRQTREHVAVKVIKNKPAYYNQALMEIKILKLLNERSDPTDTRCIVRLLDYFLYRNHLCLVFELLNVNLYELVKQNQFRGLSCNLIRAFLRQILDSLKLLREYHVVHCDLKPENILLKNLNSPQVKLIDFGSACFESQTVYSYIQSRFYRSPEVLLGLSYDAAIDMWSLGCIAAELFLGLPLFPGINEFNQITRIVEMNGLPPLQMLEKGKSVHKFFTAIQEEVKDEKNPGGPLVIKARYVLKTPEEYAAQTNTPVVQSKRYFKANSLQQLVESYPFKKNTTEEEKAKEMQQRRSFVHLLSHCLELDPALRWTPAQAVKHPFITGKPFLGDFIPPAEPPRTPLMAHRSPRIDILASPHRRDTSNHNSTDQNDPQPRRHTSATNPSTSSSAGFVTNQQLPPAQVVVPNNSTGVTDSLSHAQSWPHLPQFENLMREHQQAQQRPKLVSSSYGLFSAEQGATEQGSTPRGSSQSQATPNASLANRPLSHSLPTSFIPATHQYPNHLMNQHLHQSFHPVDRHSFVSFPHSLPSNLSMSSAPSELGMDSPHESPPSNHPLGSPSWHPGPNNQPYSSSAGAAINLGQLSAHPSVMSFHSPFRIPNHHPNSTHTPSNMFASVNSPTEWGTRARAASDEGPGGGRMQKHAQMSSSDLYNVSFLSPKTSASAQPLNPSFSSTHPQQDNAEPSRAASPSGAEWDPFFRDSNSPPPSHPTNNFTQFSQQLSQQQLSQQQLSQQQLSQQQLSQQQLSQQQFPQYPHSSFVDVPGNSTDFAALGVLHPHLLQPNSVHSSIPMGSPIETQSFMSPHLQTTSIGFVPAFGHPVLQPAQGFAIPHYAVVDSSSYSHLSPPMGMQPSNYSPHRQAPQMYFPAKVDQSQYVHSPNNSNNHRQQRGASSHRGRRRSSPQLSHTGPAVNRNNYANSGYGLAPTGPGPGSGLYTNF